MEHADYIVIGSGCTGAMTAQTLDFEKGVDVASCWMVAQPTLNTQGKIPDKDYLSVRKNEAGQYEYFIGENFEGIPFGKVKTGEHLTPPRKFMLRNVKGMDAIIIQLTVFPFRITFKGRAWQWMGALVVACFSGAELKAAGLKCSRYECCL